jgi:two-component system cell cycle response regulator
MSARILVVDDVPANTRLMEAKLAREYYRVRSLNEGAATLAAAAEWQPDAILLDVMMPGMDGYEVCRRLKRMPDIAHVPVIMLTALTETEERVRGIEAGADDFLTKPVDDDHLFTRLASLVRLKRLLDEWRVRARTLRDLGMAAEPPLAPQLAGSRALLVTDDAEEAQLLKQALLLDGVGSFHARGPEEAVAALGDTPPDLIVIALGLAEDGALRLLAEVRAGVATREIPVLVLAEPGLRPRMLRAIELGASDTVPSPVEDAELRARARNQIRRKLVQDRLRADLGMALEQAVTDPLTGVFNRRYLRRHLQGLLAGRAPGVEVAALVLDLDHFKAVNDQHGHAAGDEALRAVARTLRANLRAVDTVARYGGEEFVVVMPATTEAEAAVAGERLRQAVAEQPAIGATRITVSIGVAVSCREEETPETLIGRADQALYGAKRAGRNRVQAAA